MSEGAQLEIRRVFLKDASFEAPQDASVFQSRWKPHLDINLNTSHLPMEEENLHEVVLRVTITAKQEDEVAFLVEVQQAGVFRLTNIKEPQVPAVIQTHCANVLFPFARETIASLVTRGGFPQLLLGPMDFQALYRQKIEAIKEQKTPPVTH